MCWHLTSNDTVDVVIFLIEKCLCVNQVTDVLKSDFLQNIGFIWAYTNSKQYSIWFSFRLLIHVCRVYQIKKNTDCISPFSFRFKGHYSYSVSFKLQVGVLYIHGCRKERWWRTMWHEKTWFTTQWTVLIEFEIPPHVWYTLTI